MNAFEEKRLPSWLLEKEPARPLSEKGRPLMDRTLSGVLNFADDALFNETFSRKKGFLQSIDARVKAPVLLGLVFALSFEKSPLAMLPYPAFALLLALISRIPLKVYFKRVLPGFLLTLLIALPAAFSFIVKGEPLVSLFSGISITREGLLSALTLLIRVSSSLMFVFLLTFTSTPSGLIKGLGFYMPGFLKTLLAVSYRYIFFLVRRLEEFIMVGRARVFSWVKTGGEERRIASSRAAALLLLSLRVKEDLRMAMEARGAGASFRDVPAERFRIEANGIILILLAIGIVII
jgi:cobalt/nickel transport system permease protein